MRDSDPPASVRALAAELDEAWAAMEDPALARGRADRLFERGWASSDDLLRAIRREFEGRGLALPGGGREWVPKELRPEEPLEDFLHRGIREMAAWLGVGQPRLRLVDVLPSSWPSGDPAHEICVDGSYEGQSSLITLRHPGGDAHSPTVRSLILATLAHEMTHDFAWKTHLRLPDVFPVLRFGEPRAVQSENERFTDVTSVWLGFGPLIVRARSEEMYAAARDGRVLARGYVAAHDLGRLVSLRARLLGSRPAAAACAESPSLREVPVGVLLDRWRSGDRRAPDEIVRRFDGHLRNLIRRISRLSDLDEDEIAQEAWASLSAHGPPRDGDLPGLLEQLASDTVARHPRRKKGGAVALVDQRPSALDRVAAGEISDEVVAVLERLPEMQRRAFVLVHLEEEDPKEAAKVLGVSPARVEQLVTLACGRLRRALAPFA